MLKIFLIISVISSNLLTVRLQTEECPPVKLMRDFKPEKYMGKWYEIQKYPMIFEDETKCVTAEYTLNPNGTIDVFNSAILQSIDEEVSISGTATPDPSNPANLTVQFEKISGKGKYWVLETDYTSYSLVYACIQGRVEAIRFEFAWILSRTPKLNGIIIKKLTKKLAVLGSTTSNFEVTDQNDCDYDE